MKTYIKIITFNILLSLILIPSQVWSYSLTIDRILYENDGVLNPRLLSGTVDIEVVGDYLNIVLTNTSGSGAVMEGSSSVWLTGLAINLPDGFDVRGGTAGLNGSRVFLRNRDITGTIPGANVSMEWGYTNGRSGHFNDAYTNTDTQFSTMIADAANQFAAGSLDPSGLNGPSWGLISSSVTPGLVGRYQIQSSILISAHVTGSSLSDIPNIYDVIDRGEVVLTFGSPDAEVPEPNTFILLGSGLLSIAGVAALRKRFNAVSIS